MTLPITNLSLGAIQNEFLGDDPISLSEYYRGGLYVGAGITSAYGTIPTSGQISMGVFRGTSAFVAGSTTFTANGTFTVPAGYTTLTIEVWGGGGQGSGAAQPSGGYYGTSGETSSVSGTGLTTMIAGGGQGGGPSSSGTLGAGGPGGGASGGTTSNISGGNGTAGTGGTGGMTGTGGTAPSGSISGGAGGAGVNSQIPYLSTTNGNPGSAPGGGGGGGVNFVGAMGMCGGQFYSVGGGAGAGAYSKTITSSITAGTVLTVTVGAGGVYIAGASPNYGGAGGNGRVIITYA
jgi:hypothetical protein